MPDFGSPVAQYAAVDPKQGLETLSSLMGLRRAALGIEADRNELQQLQQTTHQRAGIAKINWAKHIGQDGVLDTGSFAQDPAIREAAGDQYADVLEHANKVRQGQLMSKQQLFNLTSGQNTALREQLGGLTSDPDVQADNDAGRQKFKNTLSQFGQTYGQDAQKVASIYSPMVDHVPQGKLTQALKVLQLQSSDVGKQLDLTTDQPDSIQTGGATVPGTTGARLGAHPGAFTPAGSPVQNTLPPGAQVLKDQAGAQYLFDPQRNTVTRVGMGHPSPPGASAGAAGPPGAQFRQPSYPGQDADIESNQGEIRGIRAAGDQAPQARNINQQILRLSQNTNTGPLISWARSSIPGLGGLGADDYQELGKYLEKNAISNMQSMGGPPSDARLSAATAANGSTAFNPGALQAVTKFNDATTSGVEKFRQGVDAAVGLQNPDYTKLAKFKSDWTKNLDVDVFRLENAVRDGDQAEQRRILSGMTPSQRETLRQKRLNLNQLASKGALP